LEPLNDIDRAILKRLTETALPTSILPDRSPNIEQPHAFLLRSRNPTDLNLNVFDGDNGDYLATGPDAKWAEPQQPRVKALEFLGYDFMTLSNRAAADQAGALTSLVKFCLKKNPSGVWPESEDEVIATMAPPSDRTAPALFQHYCGKCHGPSSDRRLPLEDLVRLRQVRSATGDSPLDLLRSRSMPRAAPAIPALSDSEREALIDLLKGGAS
jgi:mono/diheme cytochrome c family protein